MRSVKIDRKASRPRGKGGRGSARATRNAPAPQRPFGRRKKPNAIARTWRAVTSWFVFRRPMLTAAAALILLAAIGALFVGGTVGRTLHTIDAASAAAVEDAGFGISQVHIIGNARTPGESIVAALGFKPGQSIFGADIATARLRLKKLDWVADADVRRRYPDDVSVRIVEKLPFALWQAPDQKLWVVERDGGLITTDGVEQFRGLPLLAGAGGSSAADIVDAVAQHRAISARVRGYERVSERRWNLILDDGVTVKLPEQNWSKELDALDRLIIDNGILEHDVVEIDLRSPTHIFFVLKSGEKKSETRGNAA
ncbi:MAG TPA: FtsQ-type POTRA domain-containing protein [Rhizomicrobium sp.]|nr:FtsQ-type POTRA domain-containing protein [Rhizomicrobium sp.]